MKKSKIISIIISFFNLILCWALLIFMTPKSVPLLSGIHDEVIVIGSKWWLIVGTILPFIMLAIATIKNNKITWFWAAEFAIIICYENLLGFSYFCSKTCFCLGEQSQIPLALALFLPIALALFVYCSFLKNMPYKNKFGIYSKRTTTTEFIWKQTHISASRYFLIASMILFVISIVFIFVHLPWLAFILFVFVLFVTRIILEVQAKKMTDKYNDLNRRNKK